MARPIWLSWSSGKDSAWALHVLRTDPRFGDIEVTGLLTTVNEEAERVAMHGVREELLQAQARAAGLPLHVVRLPYPCSNEAYAERMRAGVERAKADGVTGFAFGDLFLEDLRDWRTAQLTEVELEAWFPIWLGQDGSTAELAATMQAAGTRAVLSCVDTRVVPEEFAGRAWDAALLADLALLPGDVDPCGENGEFHTLVTAGPALAEPLSVRPGELVVRDGFAFRDLVPGGA